MQEIYLITMDEIKKRCYIDDNVNDDIIKMCILDCQETILEPVLGSTLYEYLLAGIAVSDLGASYQDLINLKCRKVLIHGTKMLITKENIYKITAASVASKPSDGATAISLANANTLVAKEESILNHHINKLTLYLQANASTYPQYHTNDEDGLTANQSPMSINVYLEDDLSMYGQ